MSCVAASLGASECNISHQCIDQFVAAAEPKDDLLLQYASSFPLEQYEIVNSPSLGSYFIERNGTDMIKRVIREGWYREGHVFWPLSGYIVPGSVAVDMGGHIGTHTRTLSCLVGPSGTVHVFEPQLKLFVELLINMHLNDCSNVVFHRAALGDHEGSINMNPGCPDNEGGVSVGRGGDPARLMKLDDLHLENVSVIKIDVEGMEMQALEGAADTIRRNRPVMAIEIMDDVEARINTIKAMGYSVTHLGMHDYLFVPIEQ